jgi:hypothetical protein
MVGEEIEGAVELEADRADVVAGAAVAKLRTMETSY